VLKLASEMDVINKSEKTSIQSVIFCFVKIDTINTFNYSFNSFHLIRIRGQMTKFNIIPPSISTPSSYCESTAGKGLWIPYVMYEIIVYIVSQTSFPDSGSN